MPKRNKQKRRQAKEKQKPEEAETRVDSHQPGGNTRRKAKEKQTK